MGAGCGRGCPHPRCRSVTSPTASTTSRGSRPRWTRCWTGSSVPTGARHPATGRPGSGSSTPTTARCGGPSARRAPVWSSSPATRRRDQLARRGADAEHLDRHRRSARPGRPHDRIRRPFRRATSGRPCSCAIPTASSGSCPTPIVPCRSCSAAAPTRVTKKASSCSARSSTSPDAGTSSTASCSSRTSTSRWIGRSRQASTCGSTRPAAHSRRAASAA